MDELKFEVSILRLAANKNKLVRSVRTSINKNIAFFNQNSLVYACRKGKKSPKVTTNNSLYFIFCFRFQVSFEEILAFLADAQVFLFKRNHSVVTVVAIGKDEDSWVR